MTLRELGCVADFEFNVAGLKVAPNVLGEVLKSCQIDNVAILCGRVVALRYVDDIFGNVLFHHKPWPTAEVEAFALSYGVKPIAFVGAQNLARFQFDNLSFFFAQIATDEIVVVDFPKKADALTVFAVRSEEHTSELQSPDH